MFLRTGHKIGLLFLLMFYVLPLQSAGQSISLVFSGIRSPEGVLRVAFFRSQADFEAERAGYERVFRKNNMEDGTLRVQIDGIPYGHYGIAVLDDENSNGEMDYRFLIPREGCGFSGYTHSGFGRPRFDDFDFEFRAPITIGIRMKYY